jgi:hypothetical protein
VNTQQPYIAQGREPNNYQNQVQTPYIFRSPFTYQVPYSTTRAIGPHTKVKAVYLNDGTPVPKKVQEVYHHGTSGTAQKIHQTVPAARFSKNPSYTQV